MKRRSVFSLLLALLMVLSLAGCRSAEDKLDEAVYGTLDKVDRLADEQYTSYEDIVDKYSIELEETGEQVEQEFKQEAPARYEKDGTLSKLLNEKTKKLSSIYQKGLTKLSEHMFMVGDEDYEQAKSDLYSAYRDAEDGLMDVYTDIVTEYTVN